MSKAFTKEDDAEVPDRVGRRRTSSGLPPGAVNYITEEGARRLRRELEALPPGPAAGERIAYLRDVLASATIVPTRAVAPEEVLFGAAVTLRSTDGTLTRLRIVGVDEGDLEPGWVSWQSPLAKSLLGVPVGQQVQIPDLGKVHIVEIAP